MVGFCWGKSHLSMDNLRGYPYDSGNTHMFDLFACPFISIENVHIFQDDPSR